MHTYFLLSLAEVSAHTISVRLSRHLISQSAADAHTYTHGPLALYSLFYLLLRLGPDAMIIPWNKKCLEKELSEGGPFTQTWAASQQRLQFGAALSPR